MTGSDEEYFVWSNEHRAWWRPNSRGYCLNIADAGIYSREEAIAICALGRDGWNGGSPPDEIPVRVADVNSCQSAFEAAMKQIKKETENA